MEDEPEAVYLLSFCVCHHSVISMKSHSLQYIVVVGCKRFQFQVGFVQTESVRNCFHRSLPLILLLQ